MKISFIPRSFYIQVNSTVLVLMLDCLGEEW
jgi:hypothetical protein